MFGGDFIPAIYFSLVFWMEYFNAIADTLGAMVEHVSVARFIPSHCLHLSQQIPELSVIHFHPAIQI